MSDKLKDLFKLFGEIYNPKNLDEALSLKKVEDKFSPTAIIVDAEKPLRTDEYYQEVLLDDEQRYAMSYKYGYVTMAMATEISRLRHKLDKLETSQIKVNYELLRGTD